MHGRCSIYKTPFTSFDEVTLYNDSEIISWLECGKPLQFLPSHIGFVPGQSAYAYRDKWNIPRSMPLAGTDCSQPLHHIPDEISGRLDDIPAQFVVKRYVRPQYGCDGCQRVVSGRRPLRLSLRVSLKPVWWRRCWSASTATASRCITSSDSGMQNRSVSSSRVRRNDTSIPPTAILLPAAVWMGVMASLAVGSFKRYV